MNKKMLVRTAVGLFAIAALFLLYQWIAKITLDPDFGTTDTSDMIAAVEFTEDGSHIVLFDANGKKTAVPGFVEGRSDIDPVWRPDGQRIFFSSNRLGSSNNVFRWNIVSNAVDHKLKGSRSASSPYFGPPNWPNLANSGLVTVAGNVFDFNQQEQKTRQLLPPIEFQNVGDAEAGHLQERYEGLGTSFKTAKWGKDRKVMYTVMTRENDEIFVVNFMEQVGEQPVGPVTVFAGQAIQFDVSPDGTAVVSIQGFEFPDPAQIPAELMVGGKAIKPWRNGLFALTVQDDGRIAPPIPLFTDQAELGIEPVEITAAVRAERAIPAGVTGVLVGMVGPGSVGEDLSIKTGDVVVSVEGQKTDSFNALFSALHSVKLGIPATITLWSAADKAIKTVKYTFGNESTMALKDPVFSPDSQSVAAVVGFVIDTYTFEPGQLVIVPLAGGLNAAQRLVAGRIFEPHWHPSGKKLTFAMLDESGASQIYVVGVDGSGQRNVSGPGEFGSPKFSPYLKK
jgi:hypothetical protein